MAAQQFKSDGNAAWLSEKYEEAITCFSKAIDASDKSDNEFLKVIFSNRSAAHLKLKHFDESLCDADRCISLDQKWPKGYARKGDALLTARKYTEAFNAYNTGLKMVPGDKTLTEKADQAMRSIRAAAPPPPSSATDAAFNAAYNMAPVVVPGTLGRVRQYANMFSLFLAIVYMLPLGQYSIMSYRASCGLAGVGNVIALFSKHGRPRFNQDYAVRVFPDPLLMGSMLCLFVGFGRPYLLALMAVFMGQLVDFLPILFKYVEKQAPAVEAQLQPTIAKYFPSMANESLSAIFKAGPGRIQPEIRQLAINCEVFQGLFLLIEMALPTRNLLQTMLWWQFLQLHFMIDQSNSVKRAFLIVDGKITTVTNHRFCPSVIARMYALIKSLLEKQVQRPEQQGQQEPPSAGLAGGLSGLASRLKSKCTVC